MPLTLYNTLTRRLELFEPLDPGFVRIYVCGPTVYGDSHIGHAKSYVSFDVIVRWFRHLGYRVKYVQNITDVGHLVGDGDEGEDKIQKKARAEQVDPMAVAEAYTKSYFDDMDRLNVVRPDISPRATGHIPEQIAMIERLVATGHAYATESGTVYYDVSSFPDYGKLSGRTVDELEAGTRVAVRSDKRNPADFALWKPAESGHLMRWPSPWGEGYPGWHIECSAMSTKYLGATFDIHGGGLENQFPHHECEIAQSEGATGATFARYWLHNNMVTVDGVKMGKSLGNFVTLKDAFSRHEPLAIRYFILTSHYRSPLDFSDAAIEAAGKGLERLRTVYRSLSDRLTGPEVASGVEEIDLPAYRWRLEAAMNDDFNTPQTIAALQELTREVNALLARGYVATAHLRAIRELYDTYADDVLGLSLAQPTAGDSGGDDRSADLIGLLIDLRAELRRSKQFAAADLIRSRLSTLDITLEDTAEGTRWQRGS